jgi:hypothetical protein
MGRIKGDVETYISLEWTIEDANKMGLLSRDQWIKQPGNMLSWRVITATIRKIFPDVILGLYTPDEALDIDEKNNNQIQNIPNPDKATEIKKEDVLLIINCEEEEKKRKLCLEIEEALKNFSDNIFVELVEKTIANCMLKPNAIELLTTILNRLIERFNKQQEKKNESI